MQATDVLIIGAGISGLLCATELRKADKSVRILDKGRGLGGRMATRRMAGGRLDHGAQILRCAIRASRHMLIIGSQRALLRSGFATCLKIPMPTATLATVGSQV